MQLKRHAAEEDILTVLVILLVKFQTFFNFNKNLNDDQISLLADMIVQDYDDIGIGGIWHCLTMIMKGQKPFSEKLFENMDGRKVLECLTKYRDLMAKEREDRHKDIVQPTPAASGFDQWGRNKQDVEQRKKTAQAVATAVALTEKKFKTNF